MSERLIVFGVGAILVAVFSYAVFKVAQAAAPYPDVPTEAQLWSEFSSIHECELVESADGTSTEIGATAVGTAGVNFISGRADSSGTKKYTCNDGVTYYRSVQ